ncbi:hypothetical protein FQR65_LT20858 [Abscondita terminalis]|nr:hypothetical protein FQR65_LT20858 [Abscondita terminalis]
MAQAQTATPAQAAPSTASQVVLSNSSRIIGTLEKRRAEFKSNPAALRQYVSTEFNTLFDRDYAARLVLGVHGRGASEADVKAFADALGDNLMSRYGSALLAFNSQLKVRVKSESALPGGRGVKVASEMLRTDGDPIPVDYLLRQAYHLCRLSKPSSMRRCGKKPSARLPPTCVLAGYRAMPTPTASNASFVQQDDALILRGTLDRAAAVALWPPLARLKGVRRIVLTDVTAVDSAGLALLAEVSDRLRNSAGSVTLEGQPAGLSDLCAAYRLTPDLEFPFRPDACASAPKPAPPADAHVAIVDGSAEAMFDASASEADAAADTALAEAKAAADAPPMETALAQDGSEDADTLAEDDYAAIYGSAVADPNVPDAVPSLVVYDPWEPFNRRVHRFNSVVDAHIARPMARFYTQAVPRPVRLGVSNFFDNLLQPLSAFNHLLQGRPGLAGQAMARFLINSTLGIGGIFDPASDIKLHRRREDFGQTLGVWGWKKSRYVELPFFGPRTLRDVVGLIVDLPLSPVRYLEDDKTRIFLQGLNLVDLRAQYLSLDSLLEGAVDEYTLLRDSWMQRRAYQIENTRSSSRDDTLPDYLNDEDSDSTIPVDAMPMPNLPTP